MSHMTFVSYRAVLWRFSRILTSTLYMYDNGYQIESGQHEQLHRAFIELKLLKSFRIFSTIFLHLNLKKFSLISFQNFTYKNENFPQNFPTRIKFTAFSIEPKVPLATTDNDGMPKQISKKSIHVALRRHSMRGERHEKCDEFSMRVSRFLSAFTPRSFSE